MNRVLSTAVVCLTVGAVFLPAQEKVDVPAEVAPTAPDPIADKLKAEQQKLHDALENEAAKVTDDLEARIANAVNDAERDRLNLELQAFAVGEVLPVMAAKAAKSFADVRNANLRRERRALEQAIDAYRRLGQTAEADRLVDEYDRLQERLNRVDGRDLRCFEGFGAAVGRAGFTWEGTTVLSPATGPGRLRVPSLLDTKLYDKYELRFELERVAGAGELRILLPLPGRNDPRELGQLVLDGEQGATSGLEIAQGASAHFATTYHGAVLNPGEAVVVLVTCKTNGIRVTVDGKEICDFGEMRRLRLPNDLQAQFAMASNSVHVLTPANARFRVIGVSFREVRDEPAPVAIRSTRAAGLPDDQLPLHAVWHGKVGNDLAATLKVIARNQALRTATIELRGKNGWLVRITVDTNLPGTQFQLGDAKRFDAKVKLYDEHGSGTVNDRFIKVSWRWRNARRGAKGVYEDIFSGER